jgi:hypothetical protein
MRLPRVNASRPRDPGRSACCDAIATGLRPAREELLRRPGGYLLALLEESQLPDPISWFKSRFGNYLYRFILSHPDADHLEA